MQESKEPKNLQNELNNQMQEQKEPKHSQNESKNQIQQEKKSENLQKENESNKESKKRIYPKFKKLTKILKQSKKELLKEEKDYKEKEVKRKIQKDCITQELNYLRKKCRKLAKLHRSYQLEAKMSKNKLQKVEKKFRSLEMSSKKYKDNQAILHLSLLKLNQERIESNSMNEELTEKLKSAEQKSLTFESQNQKNLFKVAEADKMINLIGQEKEEIRSNYDSLLNSWNGFLKDIASKKEIQENENNKIEKLDNLLSEVNSKIKCETVNPEDIDLTEFDHMMKLCKNLIESSLKIQVSSEKDIKSVKKNYEEEIERSDKKLSQEMEKNKISDLTKDLALTIKNAEELALNTNEIQKLSPTQLKQFFKSFLILKEERKSLLKRTKSSTLSLVKNLKELSQKSMKIRKLEKNYKDLENKFVNLKNEFNENLDDQINRQVLSRDKIITHQGLQVQKLLFENEKLRKYVRKLDTGDQGPVLPLNDQMLEFLRKSGQQEESLYRSIEELNKQNINLRKRIYFLSSSDNKETQNGNSKLKKRYNEILDKFEQSKEKMTKYKHEIMDWKEKFVGSENAKNNLKSQINAIIHRKDDEIEFLKSRNEELKTKVENESDTNVKLIEVQEQGRLEKLRFERIINEKDAEIFKLKQQQALSDPKSSNKIGVNFDQLSNQTKDAIWENVQINLNENISEELSSKIVTKTDQMLQKLTESLSKLNTLINKVEDKDPNSGLNKIEEIKILKENIKTLENLLKENFKLFENNKLLYKEEIKKMKEQDLDHFIYNLEPRKDLSSFSPSLMVFKLKQEINKINQENKILKEKLDQTREESMKDESLEKRYEAKINQLETSLNMIKSKYEIVNKKKRELQEAIQGKDMKILDLVKLNNLEKENEDLKAEIQNLKFLMAKEKQYKLFEASEIVDHEEERKRLLEDISILRLGKNKLTDQLRDNERIQKANLELKNLEISRYHEERGILNQKISYLSKGLQILKNYILAMEGGIQEADLQYYRQNLEYVDQNLVKLEKNMREVSKEYEGRLEIFSENFEKILNQTVEKLKEQSQTTLDLLDKGKSEYINEIKELKNQNIDLKNSAESSQKKIQDLEILRASLESELNKKNMALELVRSQEEQSQSQNVSQNENGGNLDIGRVNEIMQRFMDVFLLKEGQENKDQAQK